jgi:hypothetical protein
LMAVAERRISMGGCTVARSRNSSFWRSPKLPGRSVPNPSLTPCRRQVSTDRYIVSVIPPSFSRFAGLRPIASP